MIINTDIIEIGDLEELIAFTWFKPSVSRSVPGGFTLAENLVNNKGGILYPKGTDLDADKIGRLIKLRDNNPDWKFIFKLERSERLNKTLCDRIYSDFNRFIVSKESRMEFRME